MNREEAKELSWMEHIDFKNKASLKRFYVAVDKIYDDFESRTCENCEHRIEMVYCDILFTDTDGIENLWVHKDFGCNKFKRKQND